MSQRILSLRDEFRGPTGGTADHRAAASHSFGDYAAERLRLRAGVNQNIERPNGAAGAWDVAGEAGLLGDTQFCSQFAKLLDAPLAILSLINRSAYDIATIGKTLRQPGQRSQEYFVPFPMSQCGH